MDESGPLGEAVATMTKPHSEGGLGFGLPQNEGHVALQHEGGTGGYRSYVGCVPAWKRGSVVLGNSSVAPVMDLGIHLCDARWSLLWHRQPADVNPTCFDRLVGRYRMRPGFMFDVMREGDRLMVQLTGQAPYRVYPVSEWQVFYKIVCAQITFEPGADGQATRLILHQNGRDQMADRIED